MGRLCLVGVLLISGITLAALARADGQSTQPRFDTSTAAVSADVIVRDKNGRPVTDLSQGEFEIYEDGTRQTIIRFDRVVPANSNPEPVDAATSPTLSTASESPPPEKNAARGQSTVALVFDWLSDQARHDAWKAARTLLQDMQPGDYAAVYAIDRSLQRLVPFTDNTVALDRAFVMASERPSPGSSRQNNSLVNGLVKRRENSPTLAAEDGGVPESAVPDLDPDAHDPTAALAAMLKRLDNSDRYADKEQQAWAGVDALRGLVEQVGRLGGRKTVVLFSEGLSITNHTIDAWHGLEATANRLNVSFYTFDAQGLRVQSQQMQMKRELETGGAVAMGQYDDSTERGLEQLLGGPTRGLAELASATGGDYIRNTNDLATRLHQVNMDRRYYYLLGYTSTNPKLDGSFRKITVKVHRRGVTVRSRSGYLAVPATERTDRRDFEAPALAALAMSPPPSAFPLRLRALSTPMPGRPGTTALVAALDAGALTFKTDEASGRYEGQATIVARVTSPAGDVVTTRSEHYHLTGDLSHLDNAKGGEILFFAAPAIPPGPHIVEWAVRDDEAARASVARQQVAVPGDPVPVVGDLFIVRHTERAPKGRGVDDNPLAWKDLLLYPGFGERISLAGQRELSFALPLVVSADGPPPTASLELVVDGRTVATLPFELGSAEADGRLVALGRLPVSALPPGNYLLRATVSAGPRREVRSAEFTVTP